MQATGMREAKFQLQQVIAGGLKILKVYRMDH